MIVPEGLTEQEVTDIMYRVSREIARRYLFGYHSVEDNIQQGVMECIKTLNNHKFVPRGDKDLQQQLINFLRVHVRNRLSNFRRNHSFRYAEPNSKNNVAKFNLMHPLKIHSQGLAGSPIFSRENTITQGIDRSEMIRRIREALSIPMLKDFLKWQNDVKIPTKRKKELFSKIVEILGETYDKD